MSLNTATRKRCLQEAIERNLPRFSRISSTFPWGVPAGGRHGSSSSARQSNELPSFRRTPSPQRRGVNMPDGAPDSPKRRRASSASSSSGVHRISLEESASFNQQSLSLSEVALRDAGSSPSTPLGNPEAGQAPDASLQFFSRRPPALFMEQESLKRHKRTSRVLVMPSLAIHSHSRTNPLTPVQEHKGQEHSSN